ncbi:hypothetical protein [Flavobacterium reichenbachii]|nr:hypothetical protein [Flavobacterium reichenbachii]
MKLLKITLIISVLLISCKGKITDVTIIPVKNVKTYKSFILKYKSRIDPDIVKNQFPGIETNNVVYIYMPVSFELKNNTGRDIRIMTMNDNYSFNNYDPILIDNKFYEYIHGKVRIDSGDKINATVFVHLPVPIELLDKEHYDRLFPAYKNHKEDSIVIKNVNIRLQKAIDILFKKLDISISYYKNNRIDGALAVYCVDKQHLAVFRMDSIANLKDGFKYNCE